MYMYANVIVANKDSIMNLYKCFYWAGYRKN